VDHAADSDRLDDRLDGRLNNRLSDRPRERTSERPGERPTQRPSAIGSHVPVARGLASGALAFAADIGAEAVQVFVSNPRGWAPAPGDPRQDEAFRERCARGLMPAFVHAPYLVNLGSPTEDTVRRSVRAVEHSLARGAAIGARGVVVHTGSAVAGARRELALRQVREVLLPVLDGLDALLTGQGLPDGPFLLLEPTAGAGQALCATIEDLPPYLEALDWHPRVGICLDTAHAFAAGHDLAKPGGVHAALDLLTGTTGGDRLRLVHANDSKDGLGSRRDRHERIGRGQIGAAAFAELLAHPTVRGVPVVIETPGGRAAYAEDLALLRGLRPEPGS
jgi:deoxyribonuclease-4